MANLTRSILALALALLMVACANNRKLHTEGSLQLLLGPGSSAGKLSVRSFQDLRPIIQRSRQRLSDGETYGDEDFAVPPPDALLQEMSAKLSEHSNATGIQKKLAGATLVLKNTKFSLRIPTEESEREAINQPPGLVAVQDLLIDALGGKTYLFCEVEIEIDSKPYVSRKKALISGDPPPLNYSFEWFFREAVSDILRQYAAAQ